MAPRAISLKPREQNQIGKIQTQTTTSIDERNYAKAEANPVVKSIDKREEPIRAVPNASDEEPGQEKLRRGRGKPKRNQSIAMREEPNRADPSASK